MKKLLTMAMALVMAVCLAVPAYANPSGTQNVDQQPTQSSSTSSAPTGKSEDGISYWITASTKSIPDASAALAEAGIVTTGNATVAYLQDIHADGLPLEMTFYIGGGDPNAKLYVLHWNGSRWEQVAEGSGNWVHARFTNLSPVAIVRVTGVANASGARTSRTAPQTGEPLTVFIGFAVLALAGLVAVKARKKEM